MDLSWVQTGLVGLLGSAITVLFTVRSWNKVKNDNARANLESSFDQNQQRRIEALEAKNSELRRERDEFAKMLHDAIKRLELVQVISDGDPERAVEISRDSAFVDLSRPLRPRSRPPASDPFQAADPYEPPPPRGRKKP